MVVTGCRLAFALLLILLIGDFAPAQEARQKLVGNPAAPPYYVWSDQPPATFPFAPSSQFRGLGFTGIHAEYTEADTWYPSWASDGNLYSPWTDGTVNGLTSGSGWASASTGHAKIIGDDPLKLQVVDAGVYNSDPTPYVGRYPSANLVLDGVWYYGTYCLNPKPLVTRDDIVYNWPELGPFVGFRTSTDFGKTWTETPHTPTKPLFGEVALNGEPVKIGAPHFVDFGRNMEHSPDGKAYLVCHGASDGKNRRFGYNSWITGDEIYLLRVTPTLENINDASKYEFFAGHDASGKPLWSRDFARIKPIAVWRDNMGCVTMTYNAPLKKYLLCVTDGAFTTSRFNTYVLESDRITGPWKLVSYMKHFGEMAYFVNIPSKFISRDGRDFWLCYSAGLGSWQGVPFRARPAGSAYKMCLQKVRLLSTREYSQTPPLSGPDNVARLATVATSSVHPGFAPEALIDGVADGFPRDAKNEWSSSREGKSALVLLKWGLEQTIDRVQLFDRPNTEDQITGGKLMFSDGTTIPVGALPDDARAGVEIAFRPKKVKWMIFIVTSAKAGFRNIGLSEIGLFRAKQPR